MRNILISFIFFEKRLLFDFFGRPIGAGKRNFQKYNGLFGTHILNADWAMQQP